VDVKLKAALDRIPWPTGRKRVLHGRRRRVGHNVISPLPFVITVKRAAKWCFSMRAVARAANPGFRANISAR
jgi:hypothetical protein